MRVDAEPDESLGTSGRIQARFDTIGFSGKSRASPPSLPLLVFPPAPLRMRPQRVRDVSRTVDLEKFPLCPLPFSNLYFLLCILKIIVALNFMYIVLHYYSRLKKQKG